MPRPYVFVMAMAAACVAATLGTSARAQTVFYSHTSGPLGDGFTWDAVDFDSPGPNDLGDGSDFQTPDGVYYYNYTGNTTFFDDNHQAAGNSGLIDSDAWWGNPTDSGGAVAMDFYSLGSGGVGSVEFDFSWAIAGEDAPTELYAYAFDYSDEEHTREYLAYFDLDTVFNAGGAFGGFNGAAGHISLDINDLIDDITGDPFNAISEIYIDLDYVSTPGGTGEFAIDNLSLNGATSGESLIYPTVNNGSEIVSGTTFVASILQGTGPNNIGMEITNGGGEATTVATSLASGGDLIDTGQLSDEPLSGGQTRYFPGIAEVSSNQPSGAYEGDILFFNLENAADPDDTITYRVKVLDAPLLSGNNEVPVAVTPGGQLTIENASAGPHAGALRAGVRVDSVTATGPFTLSGVSVDQLIGPDDTATADLGFDRFGRRSGAYAGQATLATRMTSDDGFFLRNAAPVNDVVWAVSHDLQDTLTDQHTAAAGEDYDKTVGANTALSAATLVGGQSPTAQTYSIEVVSAPSANATVLTDAFESGFSDGSGLYVLQFTYDPLAATGGLSPENLLLLEHASLSGEWVEAIDANLDAGAGETYFAGSYADYLAGPGGGVLDAGDLSAWGLDEATGQLWGVLDHPGVFALGVLGVLDPLPGDYNDDGVVDAADYTVWRDNEGAIAGTLPNDTDGGPIGPAQYATWSANYGAVREVASTNAVPEPTGALLVLLATLTAAGVRR